MAFAVLVIAIILQIGLGTYILTRDARARVNRLFAASSVAYALASLIGLLRLLPVDTITAANLLVFSTIVVYVWSGTFAGLCSLAVFYRAPFERYRLWALYLPLFLALLATAVVFVSYLSLPDRTVIVSPLEETGLYGANYAAFSARAWGIVYISVWVITSVALLANVAVRRSGRDRVSAILLAILSVLPGAVGGLGARFLPGTFRILIPTLSSALLFLAFAYVFIRFRLFSTEELALRMAVDNLTDGILVLRSDQIVLSCNARAAELLGLSRREIVHMRIDHMLAHTPLPVEMWNGLWSDLQQSDRATRQVRYTVGQAERVVVNEVMTIQDRGGSVQGYVWLVRDVTDLLHGQEQIEARNQQLQSAIAELERTSQVQGQLLETVRTLSAPAVPILEGIIVMPISGQIDSERARRILNNLLSGIGDNEAKIAIIDITGVPVVDTAVAEHLIQAARAALLMGCRPLLVGIRPEIAQVVVELGIDLSGLVTFSDLQGGVEYAIRTLGIQLVPTL